MQPIGTDLHYNTFTIQEPFCFLYYNNYIKFPLFFFTIVKVHVVKQPDYSFSKHCYLLAGVGGLLIWERALIKPGNETRVTPPYVWFDRHGVHHCEIATSVFRYCILITLFSKRRLLSRQKSVVCGLQTEELWKEKQDRIQ